MSLSVVSLIATLALGRPAAQVGQLRRSEQELWRRMEPSIATLVEHDRPVGAAALIDDSGLFVAARAAVRTNSLAARLASGEWTKMTVLKRDGVTGLVLLQADKWTPGAARPFSAPMEQEQPGGRLLAVLGTGPIRAEFVSANHYGVLSKSRRFVTLSEFRFEAPEQQVGAALIFCENNEIIGTLNATLHRRDTGLRYQGIANNGFGTLPLPEVLDGNGREIGPSQLTVAYTVGPDIVRQVIEGFRSPTHEVVFPSLGVLCTSVPGGGAMIREIERGSAAAVARFRIGDVIHDIGGQPIFSQVDFARVMNRQTVGARVSIQITRGPYVQVKDVTIGQAPSFDKD